jgi:mannose-6-phosphate isomerase-like protein (cupin superfamily)
MGYKVGTLDELGEGYGFRKIRGPLGVTAFGVNALVYPPGAEGVHHYHDVQDELYFVHRGTARVQVGDDELTVGEGGLVHVESTTPRKFSNAGDTDLVLLVVGGKDGYVERDGQLVNPDDLEKRQALSKGEFPGVGSTEPGKEGRAGLAGASREEP